MEELIVSKEELIQLFENQVIHNVPDNQILVTTILAY
mgnify:CR=1 FL=1